MNGIVNHQQKARILPIQAIRFIPFHKMLLIYAQIFEVSNTSTVNNRPNGVNDVSAGEVQCYGPKDVESNGSRSGILFNTSSRVEVRSHSPTDVESNEDESGILANPNSTDAIQSRSPTNDESYVDIESDENNGGIPSNPYSSSDNSDVLEANHGRICSSNFVVCLKWSFMIITFLLNLLSIIKDHLPCKCKFTHNALVAMLISFVTLVFCMMEFVLKGIEEHVTRSRRGSIGWFCHQPPSNELFGTLQEILGLVLIVLQFIIATVAHNS